MKYSFVCKYVIVGGSIQKIAALPLLQASLPSALRAALCAFKIVPYDFVAMTFYLHQERGQYHGSKQLYELDDNMIIIDSLLSKIRLVDRRMAAAGLSTATEEYDPAMPDRF